MSKFLLGLLCGVLICNYSIIKLVYYKVIRELAYIETAYELKTPYKSQFQVLELLRN